ncbi:MAG: AsmA family protein, partial [Bacteroidales bacterium]|nr:AsmA family protein [Bacteroidales bacterium]
MKLPKITNKALKITLIVVGILLFLILLLSVLVSPIAKSYIEKHSVELIGRQITMDKLRVNIFNASVKIEGCHISEQDLKTDFIYFDTLKVAIRPFKLISKEVNIRYITLAGPDIKIINEGERFNFTDLLELGDTTDTDTTASEWAIGIYNINLHSGRITYT